MDIQFFFGVQNYKGILLSISFFIMPSLFKGGTYNFACLCSHSVAHKPIDLKLGTVFYIYFIDDHYYSITCWVSVSRSMLFSTLLVAEGGGRGDGD